MVHSIFDCLMIDATEICIVVHDRWVTFDDLSLQQIRTYSFVYVYVKRNSFDKLKSTQKLDEISH